MEDCIERTTSNIKNDGGFIRPCDQLERWPKGEALIELEQLEMNNNNTCVDNLQQNAAVKTNKVSRLDVDKWPKGEALIGMPRYLERKTLSTPTQPDKHWQPEIYSKFWRSNSYTDEKAVWLTEDYKTLGRSVSMDHQPRQRSCKSIW